MIQLEDVHKSFAKVDVLKGINLDLSEQGITAILGPNGSGKTTLIKCILGMVLPQKGNILFDGQSIKNQFSYRNHISHLPQIANFPENLTPLDLIHMIKDIRLGNPNEKVLLEMFSLNKELDKKLGNLSGGNRQKVNLTLALMYDSPVIILDEPSTGLDPLSMLNLKQYLLEKNKAGKQIIITTHIMSFVEEIAENIIFILEGEIYFKGKLTDLLEMYKEKRLENAIAKILKIQLDHVEDF